MVSWFERCWKCGRWAAWWLLLVGAAGCANFDMWGPGFDDTFDWGRNVRTPIKGDNAVGASTKARQIERNLGYQ